MTTIQDILPALSNEEYEALKSSIAAHGVEAPIHVDQKKRIIDGKHRRRACGKYSSGSRRSCQPSATSGTHQADSATDSDMAVEVGHPKRSLTSLAW